MPDRLHVSLAHPYTRTHSLAFVQREGILALKSLQPIQMERASRGGSVTPHVTDPEKSMIFYLW